MELGIRAETILLGIYEDRERLAGRDAHAADHQPFRQKCLYRLDLANARQGLVPLDLEGWLGHVPTSSERVMFHHEGVRLESLGLLKRYNLRGGKRTTHLRLTAEGERLAKELFDKETANNIGTLKLEDIEFLPIELPQADGSFADNEKK
jgi:hypothetical protein